MDAVKKDTQVVGVRVEDTKKRVKWEKGQAVRRRRRRTINKQIRKFYKLNPMSRHVNLMPTIRISKCWDCGKARTKANPSPPRPRLSLLFPSSNNDDV